ncbi:hypothetical protein BDW68DRAFT_58584 [Aspergillus falconensis]
MGFYFIFICVSFHVNYVKFGNRPRRSYTEARQPQFCIRKFLLLLSFFVEIFTFNPTLAKDRVGI